MAAGASVLVAAALLESNQFPGQSVAKGDEANTVVAHEATEVQKALQVALWFVMVLTIPLVTTKPMQEGVGERGMNMASKAIFIESMSRIRVLLEHVLKVEWFRRGRVCWVLEETVLEVDSGEGACLGGRLLFPVVALSFHQ
jgi:hypothetical protein